MLTGESGLAIAGQTAFGPVAVALSRSVHPDRILLELRLPGDLLQGIAAYAMTLTPESFAKLETANRGGEGEA